MGTTIIATIANEEDGIAAVVAQISTGYSVALQDTDSGEYLDTVRVFPTAAAALAYAETVAGPR